MQVSVFWIFFCLYYISSVCQGSDIETNELKDSEPQQPEKKSRLVTFNNDHGEVKIELDFSVPFLKIPVHPRKFGGGEAIEPLLEINGKGLITVATMIFFLITFVPKIVKLFIPQAHATVTDGFIPLMSRLDEALHTMNIPTKECYQKSACWIASGAAIKPEYLNNFSPDWLKNTLETPEIQEALQRGQNGVDCNVYKCAISIQSMSKLVTLGKNMLFSDNS